MTELSKDHLIKCLSEQSGYKSTKAYIDEACEHQKQQMYQLISDAMVEIVLSNKINLMAKLQNLRFFKDIFESGNIELVDAISEQVEDHILKVAMYNKTYKQLNRGENYFIEIESRPSTKENKQMGNSYVLLATEIIKNLAEWSPVDLEDQESRFVEYYKHVQANGIVFPKNSTYFKPQDGEKFKNNFKNWINKQDNKKKKNQKLKNGEINPKQEIAKPNPKQEIKVNPKDQIKKDVAKKDESPKVDKKQQLKVDKRQQLSQENYNRTSKIPQQKVSKNQQLNKQNKVQNLQKNQICKSQVVKGLEEEIAKLKQEKKQSVKKITEQQNKNQILIKEKQQQRLKYTKQIEQLVQKLKESNKIWKQYEDQLKKMKGLLQSKKEQPQFILCQDAKEQGKQIEVLKNEQKVLKEEIERLEYKLKVSDTALIQTNQKYKTLSNQRQDQVLQNRQIQKANKVLNIQIKELKDNKQEQQKQNKQENKSENNQRQETRKEESSQILKNIINKDDKTNNQQNLMSLSYYFSIKDRQRSHQNQKTKKRSSGKTENSSAKISQHSLSKKTQSNWYSTQVLRSGQNWLKNTQQLKLKKIGRNYQQIHTPTIVGILPFIQEYFDPIKIDQSFAFRSCCLSQHSSSTFFSNEKIEARMIETNRKLIISMRNRLQSELMVGIKSCHQQFSISEDSVVRLMGGQYIDFVVRSSVTDLNLRFPLCQIMTKEARKQQSFIVPLPITLFSFCILSEIDNTLRNTRCYKSQKFYLNKHYKSIQSAMNRVQFSSKGEKKEWVGSVRYKYIHEIGVILKIVQHRRICEVQISYQFGSILNESFSKVLIQILMFMLQ